MKFLFTILLTAFTTLVFAQSYNGAAQYIVRTDSVINVPAEVLVTPTTLSVNLNGLTIEYNNVKWIKVDCNVFQLTLDDIYYTFDTCKGRLVLYGMEDEATADSYRQ